MWDSIQVTCKQYMKVLIILFVYITLFVNNEFQYYLLQ